MTTLKHLHWPLIPGMGALALPSVALHRANGCAGVAARPSTSRGADLAGLAPDRRACPGTYTDLHRPGHGAVSLLTSLATRALGHHTS